MIARLCAPLVSVFVAVMAAVAAAHPLYHWAEGGSVDAVLDYFTAVAAQLAGSRTS